MERASIFEAQMSTPALFNSLLLIVSLLMLSACGNPYEYEITPITVCPDGAMVNGAAPPNGFQQRCMKGDTRHGMSRSWYANGHLRTQTHWKNGIKHGKFTLWYENGQKRAQGEDADGFPVGKWVYWDMNGEVFQEREF